MSSVIGIHDGHNASAALVRDGRIEIALQEERLTRCKNQGDVPAGAVRQALDLIARGSSPARLALNGRYVSYNQWQREVILRDYDRSSRFPGRWKQPFKNTFVDRVYQQRKAEQRTRRLEELGFGRHQMEIVEHHAAHAAAAYHTAPFVSASVSGGGAGGKALVLTCDGAGDRVSATVSIGQNGGLTRIAEVPEQDSIGRLYALVTRYLGMAPLEHEYKVMGLAPYGQRGPRAGETAALFSDLFEFTANRLVWRRRRGVPSMYAASGFLGRLLEGRRFDVIAAGIQGFLEQMLATWVRNAVRETGIRKIACAGGVFMNVKANLALLELPEVEELYVFPSCGDESNSIGAACHVAAAAGESIQPLGAIYYGDPITDEESEKALRPAADTGRLRCRYEPRMERLVAEKLAQGKIVARAKGNLEFGARALGNRSILARADSLGAVRVINDMVKNRDFWMPFAPSVLAERAEEYYFKPKPVSSPYMMLAFRSRPEKRASFAAAQHPCDFTTRPHEVEERHNPSFHALLKEYEARTGEGIVLNTSFNLHGDPIVYRAADAVDVFLRSGLEYLALGQFWVEKT